MAVIPEVLNRESIPFKKIACPWILLLKAPTSGFAGMTTFYEFINYKLQLVYLFVYFMVLSGIIQQYF